MSRILLSYRREDSADVTGRIYDRLIQQFGRGTVFKDVDSMPFGVDFRVHLDAQVAKCEVFLAVIGRDWLKKRGSKGKSRLEDPGDFVRIEVESALKRQIPVIPVLVSGAAIPSADRLPNSLRDLSYRNGLVVRPDPDFHRDMDRLIDFLTQEIEGLVHQKAEPSVAVVNKLVDMNEGTSSVAEERPSRRQVEAKKPTDQSSSVQNGKTAQREAPFEMVKVSKGIFLYGDEKTHVTIDHDYWIDEYPVTNQRYRAFIEVGGYENQAYWAPEGWKWKTQNKVTVPEYWNHVTWNKLDHPVVGVSYYEAEAFARWAGKRLPTEQEWEKAARGEDGREYPWGKEFDKDKSNSRSSEIGHTTPVTQYPKGGSPYGCYDMVGNVLEWSASWYDKIGGLRVLRGGAWYFIPEYLRVSTRLWYDPDYRDTTIGFRLAHDIQP
jgi:formylglycine-generating enzyme required for sulfatase activity